MVKQLNVVCLVHLCQRTFVALFQTNRLITHQHSPYLWFYSGGELVIAFQMKL